MTREQEKRRDNFMRLARMANVVPVNQFYVTDVFLEKFAEMVAAEEREACLALVNQGTGEATSADALKILHMERDRISAAIRARGEQEKPR